MKPLWLVTPYFFNEYDDALTGAVPDATPHQLNNPGGLTDRSCDSLQRTHAPISHFTALTAKSGDLPVSVAGDCAASLPVMAGLQAAGLAPALVWLDAHGDFNTPQTSPSGFLGGMPLAMMVGRGDLALARASGHRPVPEHDVWLIDARDLDPLERTALDASQINRRALSDLAGLRLNRSVHLHIDNDIIDLAEVPANNYPVPDGPTLDKTIETCTDFVRHNDIRAISFSGWNGKLDTNGKTRAACARLLNAVTHATARRS